MLSGIFWRILSTKSNPISYFQAWLVDLLGPEVPTAHHLLAARPWQPRYVSGPLPRLQQQHQRRG